MKNETEKPHMPGLAPVGPEAEKLAIQAESGGGRTMARPSGDVDAGAGGIMGAGGIGDQGLRGGSTADVTSGMSGAETNDAMPGGGAGGDGGLGDLNAPDTAGPKPS